jgi:hypothetical protein
MAYLKFYIKINFFFYIMSNIYSYIRKPSLKNFKKIENLYSFNKLLLWSKINKNFFLNN